jgi:peptidoglycan/xylan/chitin deacetylase (PgdA/CDA1 family)
MGNAIDMYNFNSRKILYKKMFVMSSCLGVLILGLYIFNDNHEFFANFQVYYFKSYITILAHRLDNEIPNSKNLIAAIGAVNHGVVTKNDIPNDIIRAKSIPVLLYHGIINKPDGSNILLEDFKNQMFALKRAGWQTVNIGDFDKFMKGEKKLPDKSFLLTFDDGRKDSYYPVDPILKALDYHAAIFIITEHSIGNTESNFHLSQNELKQMAKSGRWDIEAHTRNGHDFYKITEDGNRGHFHSNKLWLNNENRLETEEEFTDRVKSDIIAAKNDLENELEIKVTGFAYPFGDFGQNSVNFSEARLIVPNIIKSVYPLSFYQVWPAEGFSFNYPDTSQILISRIGVKPYWTPDNLLKVLEIGSEKTIPFFDNFSSYQGWINVSGRFSINNTSMILDSNDGFTTKALIFLDGSYLWNNYFFKSEIELLKGRSFALFARYKNNNNYVSCEFTTESITVSYVADGMYKIIKKREDNFMTAGKVYNVGIRVKDDVVECYIDNKVTAAGHGIKSNHGGIGFKVWGSETGENRIIIRNVFVKEIN